MITIHALYKYILIMGLVAMGGYTYSQNTGFDIPKQVSHHIPNLTIVSRKTWGADESLKYSTQPVYQNILKSKAKNAEYIKRLEQEGSPKLIDIKKKQAKTYAANTYIKTKYPQERFATQTIFYEMGNQLRRPFSYQQKTKFIIHHTVTDSSKLVTQQDVYSYLQKVQKLHALTRGRGDIGYNYLIGPDGTIYEGRAGGELVVGAHATWNNFQSIGIALIGNFEIEEVPTIQVEALIRLITQLAIKYHINPKEQKIYHKDSAKTPYIIDVTGLGIVGHKHVSNTQCPGKNLNNQLEYIRQRVYAGMNINSDVIVTSLNSITSSGQTITLHNILGPQIPSQCLIDSQDLQLLKCSYQGSQLVIDIKPSLSGEYVDSIAYVPLKLIYSDRRTQTIMLWYRLLPSSAQQLNMIRKQYITKHKIKLNAPAKNKIIGKINKTDIASLAYKNVSVLLYNTSLLAQHTVICDQGCKVTDHRGQTQIMQGAISIQKDDSIIITKNNNQEKKWPSLQIQPVGIWINITNSDATRAYLGALTWSPGQMKTIGGKILDTIIVTNQLPFRDYLYGVAEEDNQQHEQKLKTMAILVKNYALFYLHQDNQHTSIVPKQGYDFIDDPRIFQKYIGYNFQKAHPKWVTTVDEMRDKRIMYNNLLVILPYYHCNGGFTRSAKEKFGRIDTPYLSSLIDIDGQCTDHIFQGHGVGLSGIGAQIKAKKGMNYSDIISYYYPETAIVTLQMP